jgi:eukaryotic-like serine/threonine-protein kinase
MNEVKASDKVVFLEALERRGREELLRFLDDACGGDSALRARVETLLQAHQDAGSFLESPVAEIPLPRVGSSRTPVDETVDHGIAERPGTVIGHYKLLEQIGEGGFAVVFMAEQIRPVRRKVALKVLKPGMDTRQVVARFEAERQALAIMNHPNIAKVFDGGATPSCRPYFVMELVKGVPITEFCDQNQLATRERLKLFIPVCQAVQHAHQKGIIHRDLKPSNVLVTVHDTTPVVKVIDFGVAKALGQELTDKTLFTGFAQMIGTPLYMSPEQAGMSGLDIDTRSDIYSLGVLLYELLTATTPFDKGRIIGAGYDEVRRIIRDEEPPKPSTRLSELCGRENRAVLGDGRGNRPAHFNLASIAMQRQTEPAKLTRLMRGELDWIVMKCLEKDRNRRYETVDAVAEDLLHYLADEPVHACPPSAWYRFRKFARRNRQTLATVVVVATLALAGLATSTALIARALRSETDAKGSLDEALNRERADAYFHRVTLAHHALIADDLGRARKLLEDCPEDLRGWEWHYLARLCWVEPVIFRDKAEVNGLAFSPDGQWIAAGCVDGTIEFWNSVTGTAAQRFDTRSGPVFAVTYHPDGKHVATVGADRQVKVWELSTSQPVFIERCDAMHNLGSAHTVAFSRDGRQLAAGSDGAVTVWDWRNRVAQHRFPGHERRAINVAFSRDGRRLASGDWRGRLYLWESEDGDTSLCTFPESREAVHPISALSFSPNGLRLATASFGRRVDVWDTATGEVVHRLSHSGLVLSVAYHPDGRRLASAGEDKTVRLWEAETGREVLALEGHTGYIGCAAFSPDGHRLASASTDGTIRIWDTTPLPSREKQEIVTLAEHNDEVWSVAVSPEGERVASAGWGNSFVKVWNVRTRKVSLEFPGIRDVVFCVAWHPGGQRIACAGRDGELMQVKVWDAQTGKEIYRLPARPGDPEFFAVAFSPDGRHLVTGRHDGAVQVWDAQSGNKVRTLGFHNKSAIRGVVFSPQGRRLATVSGDGLVKFWDATRLDQEQEEPRPDLRARAHGPSVIVAFSPDGRSLATGGNKNTVVIWDVQSRRALRILEGSQGDIYTVTFSPDGRWIAAAGEGSSVRVWDRHSGELARSFRGHTGLVTSLAFTPDSKILVSGSRDRTVKVWDVSTLKAGPVR